MSKTIEARAARAAVEVAAAKVKTMPRMVNINLGYSCQLLIPVAKAGPVIAMLADCLVTRNEYHSDPEGNSHYTQVIYKDSVQMTMGDFRVASSDDYQALSDAMQALEVAIASDLANEAAPN